MGHGGGYSGSAAEEQHLLASDGFLNNIGALLVHLTGPLISPAAASENAIQGPLATIKPTFVVSNTAAKILPGKEVILECLD